MLFQTVCALRAAARICRIPGPADSTCDQNMLSREDVRLASAFHVPKRSALVPECHVWVCPQTPKPKCVLTPTIIGATVMVGVEVEVVEVDGVGVEEVVVDEVVVEEVVLEEVVVDEVVVGDVVGLGEVVVDEVVVDGVDVGLVDVEVDEVVVEVEVDGEEVVVVEPRRLAFFSSVVQEARFVHV